MARASSVARPAALLLAAALVVLLAWALAGARSLSAGWLVAFAIVSGVPIGSLALLMVHRLTGGLWGDALAPVLRPAALVTPLALFAFAPVVIGLGAIYPWASDAGAVPPAVAQWYLNAPAFIARAAIALLGWSVLGVAFGAGRGGRLLAVLGLAFHGLAISVVALDWFLSVEPHYVSTAFGATVAIEQMLSALAVAVVVAPARLRGKALGDVGGLLIATLLGVVYLSLMTFIVAWYGDLPEKAAWFAKRGQNGWQFVIAADALLAASAFAMLLTQRIRHSRAGLRVVGSVLLVAVALHTTWLLVPAFPAPDLVLLGATLCVAALVLVALAAAPRARRFVPAADEEIPTEAPALAERPVAASSKHGKPGALALALVLSLLSLMVPRRISPDADARRPASSRADDGEEPARLEAPGVTPRPVLWIAFGFLAFVVIGAGGLYAYVRMSLSGPLALEARRFPEPRLQLDSQDDLARLQAEQRRRLSGYAWVDREKGLISIPIADAMTLIAQRGAHALDPLDAPARTPAPGSRGSVQP